MKLRVRCPCCGLLTHIERIHTTTAYPIELLAQISKPGAIGKGRCSWIYAKITDERLTAIRSYMATRLNLIARQLGVERMAELFGGLVSYPSVSVVDESMTDITAEVIAYGQS